VNKDVQTTQHGYKEVRVDAEMLENDCFIPEPIASNDDLHHLSEPASSTPLTDQPDNDIDLIESNDEHVCVTASLPINQELTVNEGLIEEDCADYIVRYLEALGVEYVFGIPGGNIEPFYNALARAEKRGTLKHVTARHESGAVFMAEGYYREPGKLGVVCTTTGPGATNAITGVACAYGNYAPILLITAQTGLQTFGRGAWQESSGATGADSVAMMDSITRYNSLISHPQQLSTQLDKAVMYAFGPTPGPVHLSVPRDIFCQQYNCVSHFRSHSSLFNLMTIRPDAEILVRLQQLLKNAKNVVLLIGNYARNISDLIIKLAERNNWRFVTSPSAKGYVPTQHPLCAGVYGVAGHDQAKSLLENPANEVILAIGLECNEPNTCGWDTHTLHSSRLVQIADIFELLTSPSCAQMKIYATPRLVLQHLLNVKIREIDPNDDRMNLPYLVSAVNRNMPESKPKPTLVKKAPSDTDRLKPQDLLLFLNNVLPDDAMVVMDIGNSFLWGIYYWNFRHRPEMTHNKNLFVIDNGMASMGWAIGAAIGIAMGNPSACILCVTGDGAVLMSGQELTVAVEHQLNIIFVVLNDGCLGTVKHGQILAGAEKYAFKLPKVNFAMMAQAQGAQSIVVKNINELRNIDWFVNRSPGPLLLDVWIDDTQTPPLKTRVDALNTA
jgi:acetolactate synthase-1/2/3 large subunit